MVFRWRDADLEVLLAHMGGPYWARRDAGAWTIPKGVPEAGEDLEQAARREFAEELGLPVPDGPLVALGEVVQAGGKRVTAWAVQGDVDPDAIDPGTFELAWPPRSGRTQRFAEVDRVAWFRPADAVARIVTGQRPLVARLCEHLGAPAPPAP